MFLKKNINLKIKQTKLSAEGAAIAGDQNHNKKKKLHQKGFA